MRQRGGVARVRPRRPRRLVGVPHRRDDDDAARVGVANGGRLERRVRVAAGVARVADAAEREVDHARAVVDRPADRVGLGLERDLPVRAHDLGDQQLRRERDPGDAERVVRLRCDQARDERPVALLVGQRAPADEAPRAGDAGGEVRVRAVDPGVDHRDARPREGRQLGPEVERVVLLQVPLLRRDRVVRDERDPPRRVEPLDVLHAVERAQRRARSSRRPRAREARPACGRRASPSSVGSRRRRRRATCPAPRRPRSGPRQPGPGRAAPRPPRRAGAVSPRDDLQRGRVARDEPAPGRDPCAVRARRQVEARLERAGRVDRRRRGGTPARPVEPLDVDARTRESPGGRDRGATSRRSRATSLTRGATETRIGAPKSFDGAESRYSVETSGLTVATTAPPAPGLSRATGCQTVAGRRALLERDLRARAARDALELELAAVLERRGRRVEREHADAEPRRAEPELRADDVARNDDLALRARRG